MNIDEALSLLNENGYLTELTLKYKNIDREEHKKSDVHSNLGIKYPRPKLYINDGRPFYIVGNTTVTDHSLKTFGDIKELIFFTRNSQEIYKRQVNLLNYVIKRPEDYSIAINNVIQKYKIPKSDLILMINVALEDKSNKKIDNIFNILLNGYLIEFYKVINSVATGARKIYRGIGLPKTINPDEFIKTHKNLGTSWSISKSCAGTFAEIATSETEDKEGNLDPYIITAKVKNKNNIDIPTTLFNWWEYSGELEDIYTANEQEIRIKNSNQLEIVSIEPLDWGNIKN
jgi:hypothetical protein